LYNFFLFRLQELQKCVRPYVLTATKDGYAMHMILPDVLAIVKNRTGDTPASFNLRKLRKSIENCEGTSVDHSGFFEGVQRRCVKIPRSMLDEDLLELIDKGTIKTNIFPVTNIPLKNNRHA
jgi:hypothetical protein